MSQPPSGPPPEGPGPPYGPFPAYGPYGSSGQPPPYGPGGPYGSAPYYGPPPPRSGGRRGLIVGLIAAAVVIVVCVVVTAVLVLRDDGNKPHTPTSLPSGVTAAIGADGSMTMAKPGVERPLVDVYVDYQCPVCKTFYQLNESTLRDLAGEGRAKIVYHPIVIFDQEPLSGNSTRAAAAMRCITDARAWLSFQDQIFLRQPAEGAAGFSVDDLVSYGRTVGITGSDFGSCVRSQRYASQIHQATQAALASGVSGTPTVKVNGTAVPSSETLTQQGLRNAIVSAG